MSTFTQLLIEDGHSYLSRQLCKEIRERLKAGEELTHDMREYLVWGLGQAESVAPDPFKLRAKTPSDPFNLKTTVGSDFAIFHSVTQLISAGYKQKEALSIAVDDLKAEGLHYELLSADQKYKRAKLQIRCAEEVAVEIMRLGGETHDNVRTAVSTAHKKIVVTVSDKVSEEYVGKSYLLYKPLLVEQFMDYLNSKC